jgi:dihydroxy-acid dehydratase
MLYAAGVPDRNMMKNAPHVGIASVWWEGNPCNMHLLDLGKATKEAVQKQGMLAWQYNTIGVSDAITMGGEGASSRNFLLCKLLRILRHAIFTSDARNHCG